MLVGRGSARQHHWQSCIQDEEIEREIRELWYSEVVVELREDLAKARADEESRAVRSRVHRGAKASPLLAQTAFCTRSGHGAVRRLPDVPSHRSRWRSSCGL